MRHRQTGGNTRESGNETENQHANHEKCQLLG